jgi:hypothetical protein
MLGTAQEIHRYRQESGFYNEWETTSNTHPS